MGANKRTPENAKIANAILQALFDEDGLTVQQVRDAISAESDEYQTVNGVLTSLGKREEIVRLNGRYFLTALGRKQVAPADAPPGPVKPAVAAPLPAPAPARNVEETPTKDVVTYPLSVLTDLVAQDEAASLADREREHAAEERLGAKLLERLREGGLEAVDPAVLRGAEESIAALRAIEAALPGNPNPTASLSPAAIAERAVSSLGWIPVARKDIRSLSDESAAVRAERDDALAALRAAQAEREKAIVDLDRVNNETLTAYETLEDEHRAEKAAHADAKAEIASLREQLNAANAALAFYRAEPAKPSDADGHYWTEQGGRHVLSVLRPVEVGEMLVDPASVGWTVGPHHGRVVGQGQAVIDLARKLVEVAAGVVCVGGRLVGGAE